jgi:di/tricarboxylate transporter
MLALVTAGISSLLVLGLLTCILMIATGVISQQECRDAVNWEVYVTIASAFGIGIALTNSGLANLLAEGLVNAGEALGIGVAGLYGAVYLATFLISNIVTNNAAAALVSLAVSCYLVRTTKHAILSQIIIGSLCSYTDVPNSYGGCRTD